jgi:phage/plasmid-like protein (TIGR03299 family)
MTMTDTTLIAHGGSPFATDSFDGSIPLERVADLFDFDAQFAPLFTTGTDGYMAPVPGRRAVVHGDTGAVLNVVSNRYAIHQFRDVLLDNVSALLDTGKGDLDIVGAGLLDNGAVGWVQISGETMRVGDDEMTPTITVASSHSGKFATSYRTGLFRFRCSNQIGALRTRSQSVYRLKHTSRSTLRIADAREALGLMFHNTESMRTEIEGLIAQSVTDAQFLEIVERLNPRPALEVVDGEIANGGSVTRWENRRDDLLDLWNGDERVGYRGTAWGAVQAFSTWRQNDRPYRDMGSVSRPARNMAALLAGHVDRTDAAVLSAVRAVAAV